MPAHRLSDDALRAVVKTWEDAGRSRILAAQRLKIPTGTLESRMKSARSRGLITDAMMEFPVPVAQIPPIQPPDEDFEYHWRIWNQAIGRVKSRYKGPSTRALKARTKYLIVPDLHAPFHESDYIALMLEREADADVCVLMGDLGDAYAASRFTQYERVPYESELAAMTLLLEQFSERFPVVKILTGNHDVRVEKQIRERLNPEVVAAILAMTGGHLNPIRALASRYPNVGFIGLQAGRHEPMWLAQEGDAILLHAEKFSKVPGSALRAIEEWLSDNEAVLGLKPWRMAIQAHSHQIAVLPWASDRLLVECGCLAQTPGYAVSARIGGRPQRRGYVTFWQDKGRTDVNSVRAYWLDQDERLRHPA